MVDIRKEIVPVEELNQDPYRLLIAYPTPSPDEVKARISQLSELGITSLEFQGPLRMGKVSVLGKGVVGLVFSGFADGKQVAVKIRRVDSRRPSMGHEANMIETANKVSIGPRLLGSLKDVLKMQFVEGQTLPPWIGSQRGKGTRARVRTTFKSLFEQCVKLDAYGLDHGELSRAHKNVIVSPQGVPWILDFESASLMRRVNNFTSIVQYLFLSGRFARHVLRVLGPVSRDELINNLRMYKAGKTNDGFDAVSEMLRL